MFFKKKTYPVDFDPGLEYTRDSGLYSIHPYPSAIGAVSGILPLADGQIILSTGVVPWGTTAGETIGSFMQTERVGYKTRV